jgi:predicted permease
MLRELDDEMQSHLEMRIDEFRALGLSEAEAGAEALRRFGDTDEFRAYAARRAARQTRLHGAREWLGELLQDIHFARRQFQKAPGFTLIAVLTLALGIGANTAIFSVVHRLLLAPLPYPNGNRIVMPMQEDARGLRASVDSQVIHAWQARGQSIDMMAGASIGNFDVRADGTVDSLPFALVTSNYLQVLGVQPALGRAFTPEEERSGELVAMIGYELWQRAHGGRDNVLGSTVRFDEKTYTVVGVTPRGLGVPMSQDAPPDIWMPLPKGAGVGTPGVFARLRRGVSAEDASRELQAIAASLPDPGQPGLHVRAMRAQDFLDAREARMVQVLFVAVGALLLIACANVANLLLARAWTRRREFAVRVALGAGRWRLARQVLTESVLLALAGGILGVVVAWQTLRIIIALRPPALEHLADVHIEPAVLLWSAVISVTTGILFGCAPALYAGARTVGEALRSETRTGSAGVVSRWARSALIVLEIAMSLVLLVGAGLLVRSFVELQRMPLGFEPRGLVAVEVILGLPRNRDRRLALRDAIMERLRSVPGVTRIAVGMIPGKGYMGGGLETESDGVGAVTRAQALGTSFISPNYFHVAGIAVLEGHVPDSSASTEAWKTGRMALSPQVVVNRDLARRLWPNGGAIGSRVRTPADPDEKNSVKPWATVVGVVDDIHMPGLRGEARTLQVYSLIHPRLGDVVFLVRTSIPGTAAAPAIHRAITSIDRSLLVRPALSGEVYLHDSLAPTRFAMALLTAFAIIALLLSAAGLYGVIAYSVTQRTREIGVRVALGAEPNAVRRLVMGRALRLAAAGILAGSVAAAASTRVLASLLYGVSPADPLTFSMIALLVATIALLASYVPARRALRIDPIEALRAD